MPLLLVIPALIALLLGGTDASTLLRSHQPPRHKHCFETPHLCGFPDASNTGVPSGTSLTPRGGMKITRSGAVVSGVDVTGSIDIHANDVTIEDSRVTLNGAGCGTQTTCGNYDIRIDEGVTGTVIRDSELTTAPGTTCEHSIRNTSGPSLRIVRVYMHGCDSNLYGGGTIKKSFGVASLHIADDHVENVYFNETKLTVLHSTLLNPVEQTAVIFGNSGGGSDVSNCSNQLAVLGSLLAGGGYTIYPCAHSSRPGSSHLNVQDNHFARCVGKKTYEPDGGHHVCAGGSDSSGYYPNSGSYGIASDYFGGAAVWRSNVWDNNLRKVCIDGRTVNRSCKRRAGGA